MANELQKTISLRCTLSNSVLNYSKTTQANVSNVTCVQDVVIVPSAAAQPIPLGSVPGIPQQIRILNLDGNNAVQCALSNFSNIFMQIRAGQDTTFEPISATTYWKANSANANVILQVLGV